METYAEYAAHVDHPITHTSKAMRIGLGLTGAVVAVAFCATGVGAVAVATTAIVAANRGWFLGEILDNYVLPPSVQGYILKGFPTVLLGQGIKPAARAHPETLVGCHGGEWVNEGSKLVMLGADFSPMSRRQDRTSCKGSIADGEKSIIVGGAPSRLGEHWNEKDGMFVKAVNLLFAIVDFRRAVGLFSKSSIVLGAGADLADQKDIGTLLKSPAALKSPPAKWLSGEGFDYGASAFKLGETGVNVSSRAASR